MNVHLIQLDCAWEDKPANHARVRDLLVQRPPAAGSLIVLPETFSTGFSCHVARTCQTPEREDEAFLSELARAHDATVLGGVVSRGADGLARNEAVAVAPDGAVLARYAKQRPFPLAGEHEVHAAGTGPVSFRWSGLTVAPFVCYDLRFPELFREAVAQGGELLVVIAQWPVKRQQHWLTLLQARAIENQAYVLGVNRVGRDPQFTYSGRSVVVDPHGVIIADAGEQERVLTASVDRAEVVNWRREFPALAGLGGRPPRA